MGTGADLAEVLAMLTAHPARILGIRDHGVAVRSRADLVVWEAEHARTVSEPWRATM